MTPFDPSPGDGSEADPPSPLAKASVALLSPRWRVFRRLVALLKHHRSKVALISALLLIETCLGLLPQQVARVLIDDVLPSGAASQDQLVFWTLVFGGVMLAMTLVEVARVRSIARLGADISHDLRVRMFARLIRQEPTQNEDTGVLVDRLEDVDHVKGFLGGGLQMMLLNALTVLGVALLLFSMSPVLAVISLTTLPIAGLVARRGWAIAGQRMQMLWKSSARVHADLYEVLRSRAFVRASGADGHEVDRFDVAAQQFKQRTVEADRALESHLPAVVFLLQLPVLGIWYVGGGWVAGDHLTIGTLVAYLGYVGRLVGPVTQLGSMGNPLTRAINAGERMFLLLDEASPGRNALPGAAVVDNRRIDLALKPGVTEPDACPAQPSTMCAANKRTAPTIELTAVHFAYPDAPSCLAASSVSIRDPATLAIVGPSGSGKSTLLRLMAGMLRPQRGHVRVEGVDPRTISADQRRQWLCYLPQDPVLFNRSIWENVIYPDDRCEPRRLLRAVYDAGLFELLAELPDKLDTLLGEAGNRVSGGQRQRICLARALYRDPQFLLLDEATSALDAEAEEAILATLVRRRLGRSTVVVTHRLATVAGFDHHLIVRPGAPLELTSPSAREHVGPLASADATGCKNGSAGYELSFKSTSVTASGESLAWLFPLSRIPCWMGARGSAKHGKDIVVHLASEAGPTATPISGTGAPIPWIGTINSVSPSAEWLDWRVLTDHGYREFQTSLTRVTLYRFCNGVQVLTSLKGERYCVSPATLQGRRSLALVEAFS